MGKCTHRDCPFQAGYIADGCDFEDCPYRTEEEVKIPDILLAMFAVWQNGVEHGAKHNTELKPGEWIPVTERLPEEDGAYLVTYEKGYAEDHGYDMISIAPFEADIEGFGIWIERFDHASLGSLGRIWVDIPVTAWMPLPESYEGEMEE